jgi:AraC-like DNA-binding protein
VFGPKEAIMQGGRGHYPEVGRPVVAVAKEFPSGAMADEHSHARAQIIFAVEGLMVARTTRGTWVVPPGYALWVPAGIDHGVAMHGDVSMRTAYVAAEECSGLPADCRVIEVTPLLEASLTALCAEAPDYDEAGRGAHLAALILDEIARAPATLFALPVPLDKRLERLARQLIAEPGSPFDIDQWADRIGASRRTLTRLFRSQTGLSFGAWRRRLRLLTAAMRVAEGNPMVQAAAHVGYRDVAAFRAMAKRELGFDFDALLAHRRGPEPAAPRDRQNQAGAV